MNRTQVKQLVKEMGYPVDIEVRGVRLDKWLDDPATCKDSVWDGNYHETVETGTLSYVLDSEDGPYECWTIRWFEVECIGANDFQLVAWDDRFWGGDWIGPTSIGGIDTVEDARNLLEPNTPDSITQTQGFFSCQKHEGEEEYLQWVIDHEDDPCGYFQWSLHHACSDDLPESWTDLQRKAWLSAKSGEKRKEEEQEERMLAAEESFAMSDPERYHGTDRR